MNKLQNQSRGRPVGATTTAKVKVREILYHLSEEAEVPVAKSYLDAVGIRYESKGGNS
ncbi:hypothetical protein OAH00_00750 [bacterium]|nr:hypothetical protein [bacterium]